MGDEQARIAVRDQADAGVFAGLEELRALGATPFDRFAGIDLVDRSPPSKAACFDVCIEMGPPPRLA